jgi:hypothetical protein
VAFSLAVAASCAISFENGKSAGRRLTPGELGLAVAGGVFVSAGRVPDRS